ncbi:raftlin [Nelusetta ayraudi]|uniref:raftlin n=1 Tax=Nelusetta ayraudi TaxID=303726 RepID=UPI003F72AE0F
MGCRLPKLRKAEERQSPGNIYSTLRRPQVETKVGVAYTYHFLDFLLGKEEVSSVSSVLCLSSVRELPVQVRDLYAQGFVLVAVHPFVHPCGPGHAHIQRQLHRAVLVRETPSSEKSQLRWAGPRLETDVCVAGRQAADPELIQSYVKKVQDVAEQGLTFVGFLQQPGGGPCFLGHWDPEELSSLHSSPSPIHRHPLSPTEPWQDRPDRRRSEPWDLNGDNEEEEEEEEEEEDHVKPDFSPLRCVSGSELHQGVPEGPVGRRPQSRRSSTPTWLGTPCAAAAAAGGGPRPRLPDVRPSIQRDPRSSAPDGWFSSPALQNGAKTHHNNNNDDDDDNDEDETRQKSSEQNLPSPAGRRRLQLFALYNRTGALHAPPRYYSLRVPLHLQREAGLVTEVDAHWLDHMTQHFTAGAQLVDGFFHLEGSSEDGLSSADSVFIFRSSAVDETASVCYDAIVVEQWTVVSGVVVKADYVPLLQSLAPYGWRLMCVLPTPIVKTNSDGSLSTKQILFLQRPVLQRKRKDFKMLSLRGRSKAKKKSAQERDSMCPMMETEMRRLRGSSEEEEYEEYEEEEEEEERRSWGSGRSQAASSKENLWLQRGLLLSGSVESFQEVEEQQEEEEVEESEAKGTSLQRWSDVCRRGGVKAEPRMEERIKLQLFSGVC